MLRHKTQTHYTMLVLFESPAGYALFKCADGKLKDVDNIYKHFEDAEEAKKLYVAGDDGAQ